MMDERELDRAIDTAAARMMAREPGRAVSYAVMARVGEPNTASPRRFVRIAATAGVVLCAAIATLVMSRAPSPVLSLPGARPLVVGQPPVRPATQVTVVAEGTTPRRRIARATVQRSVVRPPASLPPADVSALEPIETEPIALSAIDVPMLERETPSIETIDIEPLTIEPLAASND